MGQPHKTSATEFIDHGSDTYTFLDDPIVDALMQVVIELGAECWITRRRLLVMERVMAKEGLLAPDLVEGYKPTPEDEALWKDERDRMMRSVYAALAQAPGRGDAAAQLAMSDHPPRRAPLNGAEPSARGPARGASGV